MMNSMLFEGPVLEEVLSEARLCFGADVEIEAANRVRRGGIMGFFASEWFEVWARPSAAVAANPALALLDGEDKADSFQSMVRNAMADRRMGGGQGSEPALMDYEDALDNFFGGEDATPKPAPALVGAGAPVEPVGGPATEPAAAAAVMTAPAPAPTPTMPAAPAASPTMPASSPTTVESMVTSAAVALEDSPRGATVFEQERAPKTDLLWAMLDRLDRIPAAPTLPDKGVVVFVGQAEAALASARRMGERSGLWSGDVTVVSRSGDVTGVSPWLVVNDLGEVTGRSERWRQRGVVPIVLDLGSEVVDQVWAMRAITELQADQVRLVTEAWRLADDVGRIAGKLGGVDALELVAMADTVEPLAMLDLDIPISTVEGRPATAELLAAVWLENRRRG